MKLFSHRLVLLLGCATCAPGQTSCPEQPPSPTPPQYQRTFLGKHRVFDIPSRRQIAQRMMVRKLLLDKFDIDKDHQLNDAERARLLEEAKENLEQCSAKLKRRFDYDGDGQLDEKETQALRAHLAERHEAMRQENDGLFPPSRPGMRQSEAENFLQKMDRRPQDLRKQERLIALMAHKLIMAAYDTDGNGLLNQQESDQLKSDGAWMYKLREKALLEKYDTDKDGKISAHEAEKALEDILPPRREEAPMAPPPVRNPIDRILDTHFDADIILNLATPEPPVQAERS